MEKELVSVVVGNSTTSCSYTTGMRVKGGEPGGKTTYSPFPGYEEQLVGSTTTRRDTYTIAGQAVTRRI